MRNLWWEKWKKKTCYHKINQGKYFTFSLSSIFQLFLFFKFNRQMFQHNLSYLISSWCGEQL